MSQDIESRVKKIIIDKFGIDEKDFSLSANFQNDYGADSLDVVELIMDFEEEFKINITDKDAEKITIVSDAIEYIKKTVIAQP